MEAENRKTGGIALKAGIWYVISNIMVKSIAVLTTPLFTRLMSPEEYGTVQTFISWNALLLPVFTLNLTFSIGRAKLDFPGKLDDYIGSMMVLSALFSFVLSAGAMILFRPVSSILTLSGIETVILLVYLFFGPCIQFFQNGYRYRYRYKQNIAIAWYTALATTLLSLGLIFAGSGSKADLRILGIALPTVLLAAVFWIKTLRSGTCHVNRTYWKYGLLISLPMLVHTISMHILSQSDRIFISKIWGKTDTAFYSLAYTYGMLLHVFTTAASDGWLPWFHDTYYAGRHEEIRKNVKPLVVLGCFVGLAAVAFAPEAVLILGGKKYLESLHCVAPVVLGVTCQYVYTHYVNIELHLKKTAYVSAGTITAAVFNIVTNALFIPVYGYTAAAYTTLASYFLLMVIHFVITRRWLHVHLYDDWFLFGSLIVTGIIIAILTQTYDHTAVRYGFILAGFLAFLFYFRDYIGRLAGKYLRKR